MGRPIYPYELGDPDFSWLVDSFRENHPSYHVIESSCLPVVFIEKTICLDENEHTNAPYSLSDDMAPEEETEIID